MGNARSKVYTDIIISYPIITLHSVGEYTYKVGDAVIASNEIQISLYDPLSAPYAIGMVSMITNSTIGLTEMAEMYEYARILEGYIWHRRFNIIPSK
jgi:hypothetical protein